MSHIYRGRYTAQHDEPFVVFIIGMRVNNIFAVRKWWPTATAMGTMLRTLYKHPEKGFYGGETFLYWFGIGLIQYWRSFEDLETFARDPSEPHLENWQRYNRVIGNDGSVGFWHESYLIEAGHHEEVYGNMPEFGLAKATEHVTATGGLETARQRLGGDNEPAVESPETPPKS
ncbi:MAG: DUF4188 domain-containing protein [Trueperaceae bacterium]|nr:DUF4188 domain-containing protein [Trueperaceae bacterium]